MFIDVDDVRERPGDASSWGACDQGEGKEEVERGREGKIKGEQGSESRRHGILRIDGFVGGWAFDGIESTETLILYYT